MKLSLQNSGGPFKSKQFNLSRIVESIKNEERESKLKSHIAKTVKMKKQILKNSSSKVLVQLGDIVNQ